MPGIRKAAPEPASCGVLCTEPCVRGSDRLAGCHREWRSVQIWASWCPEGRAISPSAMPAAAMPSSRAHRLPHRNAARPDVSDAFEMFQNPNCKHANNGMLSPVDFKTRQQKLNEAGVRETWGTLPACHPDVANARAAISNGAKCSRRRTGIRQRLRPPPAGRSHRPAAGCRWSPERCRQSQRRCCDRLGGPRPPR